MNKFIFKLFCNAVKRYEMVIFDFIKLEINKFCGKYLLRNVLD